MFTHPEYESRWRQHLAEHPDDAQGHAALALCLIYGGNEDEAIAEAWRAIELDPQLSLPHYVLARSTSLCRANQAIPHVRKAIELEPSCVYYYSLLAHLELDQRSKARDPARRAAAALEATEAGLRIQPDEPGCAALRGIALGRLGRFEEADAAFAHAAAVAPDSAYVHSCQGRYRLGRGNLAAALLSFEEASRLDPTSLFDCWWVRQLRPGIRLLTGFTGLASRLGLLRIDRPGDSAPAARRTVTPNWSMGLVCLIWAMASLRVLLDYVGDSSPLWFCIPAGIAAPLGIMASKRIKRNLLLVFAVLLIFILVGWIELPLLMMIDPKNISEVAKQAWPRVSALPEFHLTRVVGIISLLGSGLFLACLGLAKAIERALFEGTAPSSEDRGTGTPTWL
jgi:Flp pilus assembly protein TadD